MIPIKTRYPLEIDYKCLMVCRRRINSVQKSRRVKNWKYSTWNNKYCNQHWSTEKSYLYAPQFETQLQKLPWKTMFPRPIDYQYLNENESEIKTFKNREFLNYLVQVAH